MQATDLDTPYAVTADAVARFDKEGFVKLADVLPAAAIERYEPEITKQVIELNTQHQPMSERSTYQRAFLQIENLWQHSATVRQFVFGKRLARIASELLGVQGVRLYHDQALYKEASGGITPWHADQYYWPLATDRACTAWIPLQDTPMEMGPLEFCVGSHRFAFGRDLPISDESETNIQQALAEQQFPVTDTPYDIGDVSFHLGWTFHHAAPNTSITPRRVMTVIYIDADMTIAEPVNDQQHNDLARWMPGTRPGQVPDTPLNPVLWQRP